jgi:hypothetical protein
MRELAQKALELDPGLAEAHALPAIVSAVHDYDWNASEQHFQRALGCDSVPPLVWAWHTYRLRQLIGQAHGGIPQIERALLEDPLNFVLRFILGSPLNIDGNYAEREAQLRKAVERLIWQM